MGIRPGARMIVPYLSNNRLQIFLDCEMKYWKIYIEKVQIPPSAMPAADLGTNVHQAIQVAASEGIDPVEAYEKVCATRPIQPDMFPQGKEMVEWYFTEGSSQLDGRAPHFEHTIKDLPTGAVPIYGFIDEVREIDASTVNLIDYKSNWVIPTSAEFDDGLDKMIYCYGIWKSTHYRRFKFTWMYLRHEAVITREVSEDDLKSFEPWLVGIYDYMSKLKKPKANVGPGCQYCDVKCEIYLRLMTGETKMVLPPIMGLTTQEIAEKYDKVKAVEKVLKTFKKQLKEALIKAADEADGMIQFSDGTTVKVTQSYESHVDKKKFFEQFSDAPWFNDVIAVGITALKKEMKDMDPEELEALEPMMTQVSKSKRLNVNVARKDK